MKDLKQKLKDGLSSISKTAAETSEGAFGKIKQGAGKLGAMSSNLGDSAMDKAADVINDLIATLPLLEEAGYEAKEFTIQVAFPPVITIHFRKIADLDADSLTKIKEKHQGKKMFQLLLKTLTTANALLPKIKSDIFDFDEIIVDVTVPPSVQLRYLRRAGGEVIDLLADEEE